MITSKKLKESDAQKIRELIGLKHGTVMRLGGWYYWLGIDRDVVAPPYPDETLRIIRSDRFCLQFCQNLKIWLVRDPEAAEESYRLWDGLDAPEPPVEHFRIHQSSIAQLRRERSIGVFKPILSRGADRLRCG